MISMLISQNVLKSILISSMMLISINLSGCISDSLESEETNLTINYQYTNGTILETYSDGELISKNNVELDFDFSQTTSSNELISFGIDPNDGREPIKIDATTKSVLTIVFTEHGIYHLDAFAIDTDNLRINQSIIVRIDYTVEWSESNTNNPKTLVIDPIPRNNGPNPYMMEVSSVVENPSIIDELGGGGQTVEFSWEISDEANDVCQKRSTKVEDGESKDWYIIHFNTREVHELKIVYNDGQDNININHVMSIIYHSIESEPNA